MIGEFYTNFTDLTKIIPLTLTTVLKQLKNLPVYLNIYMQKEVLLIDVQYNEGKKWQFFQSRWLCSLKPLDCWDCEFKSR